MRSKAVLLAALLAVVSGSAAAQAERNEISLFGSWDDVSEPEDVESSALSVRYGRVVRPQVLATATLGYTHFKSRGTKSSTLSVLGGGKYYFTPLRTQGLVPFVDAAIGFATIDTNTGSDTDLTWELGGGVAYFISERTSIDGAVRLYWTDTDARTQGTRFFVGLTTRF